MDTYNEEPNIQDLYIMLLGLVNIVTTIGVIINANVESGVLSVPAEETTDEVG